VLKLSTRRDVEDNEGDVDPWTAVQDARGEPREARAPFLVGCHELAVEDEPARQFRELGQKSSHVPAAAAAHP
jgi:hypothetical protein